MEQAGRAVISPPVSNEDIRHIVGNRPHIYCVCVCVNIVLRDLRSDA